MHVVVLRREAYERDRWIAMNLFQAFEEAKHRSLARAAEIGVSHVPVAWVADHAQQWRGNGRRGLLALRPRRNRRTLDAFVQYGFEQGVANDA